LLLQSATVALLVLSLGLHWTFLQTIAWSGMLFNYSQDVGFSRAVSMTFDGDHPCSLCKVVEAGKAQEQQQQEEGVTPLPDLKLGLPPAGFVLSHPLRPPPSFLTRQLTTLWDSQPQPPPPRLS
jgi:hypothetical protein